MVDAGGFGLTVIFAGVVAALRGHRGARARPPRARARDPPAARVLDLPLLHELRGHRRGARPVGVDRGARVDRRLRARGRRPADAEGARPHRRARARRPGCSPAPGRSRASTWPTCSSRSSSAPSGSSVPTAACGVVAVVAGKGMEELFTSLGATPLPGGPTLNPSTYELLAGIHDVPAEEVVVLPNSPNVLMAAERAAELSDKKVVRRADALAAGGPGGRRGARPGAQRGRERRGDARGARARAHRRGDRGRPRRRRGPARRASTAATPSASSTSGSSPGASRPRRSRSCSASWAARPSWSR